METRSKRRKRQDNTQSLAVQQESTHSRRRRQVTGSQDLESGSSSHSSKISIYQLDDLMLTETFGKLDAKTKACVARVCKKWRDLVYSPSAWKHTTVRLNPCSISPAHMNSMKRRGIRRVMVTRDACDENLRMLIYGLPSLETIDIRQIKMTNGRMADVFPHSLPSLKKLVLRLDILDVERMGYIGHVFQNLSDLVIKGHLSQELTNVPDQSAKMLCLTSLKIPRMEIGDQMLHYLSRACPKLKGLLASLSVHVTGDGMQQLAQLKEIQQLELNGWVCPPLSRTAAAKLQNLHVLKLTSPSPRDEHLDALAHLPELEELEVTCRNISKEGWRALGRGFRKLKCLTLYCVRFSDDTDGEHFGSLLSLEKIVIKSFWATDLQMKSLCCALNHVHSMTITCGQGKQNSYMKAIADMENLKEFCLCYTAIGDEEVMQLANGKAPLENLTLVDCNIRGQSLLYIAQRKKSIRKLEFWLKMKVTTLSEIVNGLPDLQELKITVSEATKQSLQQLKPGLVICTPDKAAY